MKLLVQRQNKKPWVFNFDTLLNVFTYRARNHTYYVDFPSGKVKDLGGEKDWVVRDIVRPKSFELVN
jgi:hypothetical protein